MSEIAKVCRLPKVPVTKNGSKRRLKRRAAVKRISRSCVKKFKKNRKKVRACVKRRLKGAPTN